ncbi:hypothetical protein BLNAU_5698 [Blattamonas nauphoetae]|uniref:UVR domain-containing protein n=1 Tax=Blattamonas nauphoetae TaxID=2049346 RepID=A0ABQ9Y6Q7_9EUKA|nr:hypothetical protein BLNAU_5698 [Blattamonas nauphoetae]
MSDGSQVIAKRRARSFKPGQGKLAEPSPPVDTPQKNDQKSTPTTPQVPPTIPQPEAKPATPPKPPQIDEHPETPHITDNAQPAASKRFFSPITSTMTKTPIQDEISSSVHPHTEQPLSTPVVPLKTQHTTETQIHPSPLSTVSKQTPISTAQKSHSSLAPSTPPRVQTPPVQQSEVLRTVLSTLGTYVQSLQGLLSRKQQYAQSEQELSMKYTTQGDSAQHMLQTELSQLEERQGVAAEEENFDEADALTDAIEQLKARLAAVQDSKTQTREMFHTLFLEKAKLQTDEQEVCDTAQTHFDTLRLRRQREVEKMFEKESSAAQTAEEQSRVELDRSRSRLSIAEEAVHTADSELKAVLATVDAEAGGVRAEEQKIEEQRSEIEKQIEFHRAQIAKLQNDLSELDAQKERAQQTLAKCEQRHQRSLDGCRRKLNEAQKQQNLCRSMNDRQEQHFAEQKHQRHLLTATFSFHNVLFTFVGVESAILAKERTSLSTASQQLQHHFRELLRVSTAEEGAEDTLRAAEALVKTKEAERDEMMQQQVACREHASQLANAASTIESIQLPGLDQEKKNAAATRNFKAAKQIADEIKRLKEEKEEKEKEAEAERQRAESMNADILRLSEEVDELRRAGVEQPQREYHTALLARIKAEQTFTHLARRTARHALHRTDAHLFILSLAGIAAQWAETQMLAEKKDAAPATDPFTALSPATIRAFPATLLDNRSKQTGLLVTSPEFTQLVQSVRGDREACDSEHQIAVSRLAALSEMERATKAKLGEDIEEDEAMSETEVEVTEEDRLAECVEERLAEWRACRGRGESGVKERALDVLSSNDFSLVRLEELVVALLTEWGRAWERVEARQQDESAESDQQRDQPALDAPHTLAPDVVAEEGSSNDAGGFGFDLDEQEAESGFVQESEEPRTEEEGRGGAASAGVVHEDHEAEGGFGLEMNEEANEGFGFDLGGEEGGEGGDTQDGFGLVTEEPELNEEDKAQKRQELEDEIARISQTIKERDDELMLLTETEDYEECDRVNDEITVLQERLDAVKLTLASIS